MLELSIDDLGAATTTQADITATTAFVAQQKDGDTSGVIPGGARAPG